MADQDEVVLLERVFLRIGSADTDDQLENALKRFLAPALLKLNSEKVRTKVMELLVHINKRVKSRPKIQLPVMDLLQQYQHPTSTAFVTNFTILYIKMGYPRLPEDEQGQYLPQLLKCIKNRPETHQNSILQLVVPSLSHLKLPADIPKRKQLFSFEENLKTMQLLLEFMMDCLLLPYNFPTHTKAAQAAATAAAQPAARPAPAAGAAPGEPAFSGPPPAMSEASLKRVAGDTPPTPDQLEQIKLGILKLLGAELFAEQDIICHLVVATADSRLSVVSAADREVKRVIGSQDWNNSVIVSKLYSIFQGTVLIKGQTQKVKPEHKRTPAGVPLRLKLFPYLLKSREAANQFPACVQIVFDCLYGAHSIPRLRMMAVQFVHHLCLYCSDAKFRPIGAVLMSGMVKLIGEAKEEPKLRSLAYMAVGKIARRNPQLATKDVALLQTLFDAMCKEDPENRLAVQESLSLMSTAFVDLDSATQTLVEALIMQNIEKPETHARMMAVQYAKTVFPPNHIPSRYVLLLACGDLKDDIYNEATKALRQLTAVDSDRVAPATTVKEKLLPPFTDMVQYINEKAEQRMQTRQKYISGNITLPFNPATHGEVLVYLRMCLAYSAGIVPNLESTTSMQNQAPAIGQYVKQLVKEHGADKGPVAMYISIIKQLLSAIGGGPAMYCLLELVAVAKRSLAPVFTTQLKWIKNFMFSNKEDMRECAAQLYALVVTSGDNNKQHLEAINELVQNIKGKNFENQHGSILCLGYLIGHLLTNEKSSFGDLEVEDMEVDKVKDKKLDDAVTGAVSQIVRSLENPQLVQGACISLGEIGRCGALPLPQESTADSSPSIKSVVDMLLAKVKADKEPAKVRERTAVCAGLLCVGDKNFSRKQQVIEGLMDSAGAKQFELHCTIGEALVWAAQGPTSTEGRDKWSISEADFVARDAASSESVGSVLKLLLTNHCRSANPHIRQAACVWLLALCKECGKHAILQKDLHNIQAAFMDLLNDSDEITQDVASKGLGVVYEACEPSQKQELVTALVETLMTGKRSVQQVTGDTTLFPEGGLGKTPDGKNLSTYKELCSLATDLNQPDLIYKFMHLANHNAMWNSRKGAAFGFSTIAAQAGEQLAPHLHKILPRLYRYQFDPNPRIQQAMCSIWNALVTSNKDTVDKYVDQIMIELLKNLTASQWRVRESSCAAVQDVLRGRQLGDIVQHIAELWDTLFRVRDDIKESVRKAADLTLRSLSRSTVRCCDPGYGRQGEDVTKAVLPILLKSGLGSQVEEVRGISLSTLMKVTKGAGALVKPHIPLLLTALLESLSTLEPQMLNYVALHVAGSQTAQDKLDNARVAASKTSPMMETVNQCIQYVDGDILTELVPRLTELMKSGIGLGTKAGCAHVIVSLTLQCPQELGPFAGKLQAALSHGLTDRNATVRKTYATTLGRLVKISKDSSVEKLMKRLQDWYLNKDEEDARMACGVALQAINLYNTDVLRRHATVALPLAFLAMHEETEKASVNDEEQNVWQEVWSDVTPGTEAGIKLYLLELVDITRSTLGSQSWPRKAQAARAMATIADKLRGQLQPPHLGSLLTALLSGLSGRTWTGKESVLQAVETVLTSCKTSLEQEVPGQPSVAEVVSAVLRESGKEQVGYKVHALRCLGSLMVTYELDHFSTVSSLVYPLLKKSSDKENGDVDHNPKDLQELQEVAYTCLGKAWPTSPDTQEQHRDELLQVLCSAAQNSVWRVELAVLKALHRVLTRLVVLDDVEQIRKNKDFLCEWIPQFTQVLRHSMGNVKYASIRKEAVDISSVLITKLSDSKSLNVMDTTSAASLKSSLEALKTDVDVELQDQSASLVITLSERTTS